MKKVSIRLIIKQSKLFCLQPQPCFTLLYLLHKNKRYTEGLSSHQLSAADHVISQSLFDTHRNRSCEIYVILIVM